MINAKKWAADYPEAFLWHQKLDGQGGVVAADPVASSQSASVDWVHIRCDMPGSQDIMRDLGLNEMVIESLVTQETRPRTVQMQGGVLMTLRAINKNPGADPDDMVSLRLFVTEKMVLSARQKDRKLLSVLDVKNNLEAGQGAKDGGELICELVERIADRINEKVDDIDETLSEYEHHLSEPRHKISRQELALLRRQSAAIRRYLAPQRDALESFTRHKSLLSEAQLYDLREQTDRMTRYVEDLDLARERAVVLQEELKNQIAEQQGLRMYLLSMITAIFLPLSFLTGVFGMNVAGLPGLEEPSAFLYLASCMGGIAVLGLIYMRWQRWL